MKNAISLIIVTLILGLSSFAQSAKEDGEIFRIARDVSDALTKNHKKLVVVADFAGIEGKTTTQGKTITSKLTRQLIKFFRDFNVVPTERLNKVAEKEKINLLEITEIESLKKIKQLLGIDALVIGNISIIGSDLEVNVKIIDVESGNYIGGSEVRIANNSFIVKADSKPFYETEYFNFTLESCDLAGRILTCSITVRNTWIWDLILFVEADSEVRDEIGVAYSLSEAEFGNSGSIERGFSFIPDISVKGKIKFIGLKEGTSEIKFLRLNYRQIDAKAASKVRYPIPAGPVFSVNFEDVTVKKEK